MSTDFTGKIAVVTGAGRGLGAAFAIVLADIGAEVIMAGRNPEKSGGRGRIYPAAHRKAAADLAPRSRRCQPGDAHRQENAR